MTMINHRLDEIDAAQLSDLSLLRDLDVYSHFTDDSIIKCLSELTQLHRLRMKAPESLEALMSLSRLTALTQLDFEYAHRNNSGTIGEKEISLLVSALPRLRFSPATP